jgi:hypothetical protein
MDCQARALEVRDKDLAMHVIWNVNVPVCIDSWGCGKAGYFRGARSYKDPDLHSVIYMFSASDILVLLHNYISLLKRPRLLIRNYHNNT